MSTSMMPEKPELIINEVKFLNNLEVDPNPRTRCWRITVPYAWKDLMDDDNLYPAGSSMQLGRRRTTRMLTEGLTQREEP